VANAHVLVFQGGSKEEVKQLKYHLDLRTDSEGIAVLPNDAMPWLRVWVDWHRSCQSNSDSGIYPLAMIRNSGLVTPNKLQLNLQRDESGRALPLRAG
jgi:hypothetical protein